MTPTALIPLLYTRISELKPFSTRLDWSFNAPASLISFVDSNKVDFHSNILKEDYIIEARKYYDKDSEIIRVTEEIISKLYLFLNILLTIL